MSQVTVVRYTTRPDAGDENERLVRAVFDQLARDRPDGIRYATFRLDDGVTFVHVALIEGEENPLASLSAFGEFTSMINDRCVEPPAPTRASVVGSYGVFD